MSTTDFEPPAAKALMPEQLADELLALGANAAETLSDELLRRGERLLAVGHDLMRLAVELRGGNPFVIPEDRPIPEDRSIGRFGSIDQSAASRYARDLGRFTRRDFADKTGLTMPAAMKWIARLEEADPQLVRAVAGTLEYEYVAPRFDAPREPVPAPEDAFKVAQHLRGAEISHRAANYPKTSSKDHNKLLAIAYKAGWTITRSGGDHLLLQGPDGATVGTGTTPSNSSLHAFRDGLRRAGVDVG